MIVVRDGIQSTDYMRQDKKTVIIIVISNFSYVLCSVFTLSLSSRSIDPSPQLIS
jgi:hypothetical protein